MALAKFKTLLDLLLSDHSQPRPMIAKCSQEPQVPPAHYESPEQHYPT